MQSKDEKANKKFKSSKNDEVLDPNIYGIVGVTLHETLKEFNIDPKQVFRAFGAEQTSSTTAPSILLRGRVESYNRFHGKWRMLLKDAQIRPRFPLPKNRRKREYPSLWDVSQENENNDPPAFTVEILAYNDIE